MLSLAAVRRFVADPRHYQIGALAGLNLYAFAFLDFGARPAPLAAILVASLATQWAAGRIVGAGPFEPRSALISAFGLSMLLRTNSLALAAATAFVSVGSKFAIRVRGKHLFNPTNFGIVLMTSLFDGVWISPGQWGSAAFFGFLVVAAGGLVVTRAARSDITIAFLAFHAAILFGRSWWLNEPLAIPLHRIQNGAILIFAFHMISDPRTTPWSRSGRLLFALLVALGGGFVSFVLYRPNGVLYALVLVSLLTPLIDRLLPGPAHRWMPPPGEPPAPPESAPLERVPPGPSPGLAPVAARVPAVRIPGSGKVFAS